MSPSVARRWRVIEVLEWTAARFAEEGLQSPRLDAELLLAEVLGLSRVRLYMEYDRPLEAEERAAYRRVISRRLEREPVAYILGRKEFWSLGLEVSRETLIPRPESELLVEEALRALGRVELQVDEKGPLVVDVGTGCGAIALAIASEREGTRVLGTDLSPDAVKVARANASRLGIGALFEVGDLLAPVSPGSQISVIVANLPYITTTEMSQLSPEIRDWEPAAALEGGADGLEVIRRLVPQAAARLRGGGLLAMEMAPHQIAEACRLLNGAGFKEVTAVRDYGGRERVARGRRPPETMR